MKDVIFESPFEAALREGAQVGSWQDRVARAQGAAGVGDATDRGVMVIRGDDAYDAAAARFGARLSAVGDVVGIEIGVMAALRDDLLMLVAEDHASLREARHGFDRPPPGKLLTVTDVTHARANVLLTGPYSVDALARICAIDLSPQAFPDPHVASTMLAGTQGVVIRRDANQAPTFFLSVGRSLAGYLWKQVQEVLHAVDGVMLDSSGLNACVGNWPLDASKTVTGMSV